MVQHRVDTTNRSSNNNNIYVSDNIPVRRLPGTHWYSSSRHNGGGAELRQQQQQQLPERQHQQYPTTSATPSSHHRILRLPGCQLRPHADWMAEHFTTTAATTSTHSSSTSTGTEGDNPSSASPSSSLSSHSLYCHSAWWLHLEGTLASTVPAARWDDGRLSPPPVSHGQSTARQEYRDDTDMTMRCPHS